SLAVGVSMRCSASLRPVRSRIGWWTAGPASPGTGPTAGSVPPTEVLRRPSRARHEGLDPPAADAPRRSRAGPGAPRVRGGGLLDGVRPEVAHMVNLVTLEQRRDACPGCPAALLAGAAVSAMVSLCPGASNSRPRAVLH